MKIMNKLDNDYKELLLDIMTNGVKKNDRTKTGTLSVFGRQIRHKMSEGFPVITTKKMYWKGIVTELIWFLRGDTNIKFLVDNDCHIWDGDAYKRYVNHWGDPIDPVNFELYTRLDLHPNKRIFTKEEFINKIKTDDEFAKSWGELGPIYGKQWRRWTKYEQNTKVDGVYDEAIIDQIQNLINDLKTNPDSRRLMVNAWNVGELDNMVLPPCHYGFQVWTRELSDEERIKLFVKLENPKGYEGEKITDTVQERLTINNIPTRAISLMWNQRSIDTGLGLPYNITSYALLLTILGKMTNMIPEEFIGNLGDTHIYSDHIDGLKEQLTREPYQLPTLKINSGNENWHLLEFDEVLNTLDPSITFKLENYQSHPTIKLPLSN
jgi:thymidylate synthase